MGNYIIVPYYSSIVLARAESGVVFSHDVFDHNSQTSTRLHIVILAQSFSGSRIMSYKRG